MKQKVSVIFPKSASRERKKIPENTKMVISREVPEIEKASGMYSDRYLILESLSLESFLPSFYFIQTAF